MSNQLHINLKMKFTPSSIKRADIDIGERDLYVSVSGDSYINSIQEIGVTAEAVTIPSDIATPGYVFLKNLDSTNYIQVGDVDSQPIRLNPGEIALCRLPDAIYAKADTAPCLLEYYIFEE